MQVNPTTILLATTITLSMRTQLALMRAKLTVAAVCMGSSQPPKRKQQRRQQRHHPTPKASPQLSAKITIWTFTLPTHFHDGLSNLFPPNSSNRRPASKPSQQSMEQLLVRRRRLQPYLMNSTIWEFHHHHNTRAVVTITATTRRRLPVIHRHPSRLRISPMCIRIK